MGAYEYTALDARGREKKGILEGDAARAIRAQLREQGLTPLEVSEVSDRKSGGSRSISFRRGISVTELSLFTRQLATLTHAGLPMEEALKAVAEQTDSDKVRKIIVGVRSQVVEGHTLADALGEFPNSFDELYRATTAAGEQSGRIDEVLNGLADYVEDQQSMRQKVMAALIYPAFLSIVAIAIVIALLTTVVPDLVQVFDSVGADLPALTTGLISVSDFLRVWGWLLTLGLGAAVTAFIYGMRRPAFKRAVQARILQVPLIGRFVRGVNTARFTRTLSILTRSGVPALDAMTIGADVVTNLPMRDAIKRASTRVREGEAIHRALGRERLFPPITLHMIANGEISGELDMMLGRAAEHQEREVETLRQGVMGILGPAVILLMGGLVLIIVLAILQPVFNLNQLVK
ncbi:T2aSS secretion system inner membrane platform protein GspF [Salinisphaera shabanensis E1L3A]|uniref:General secretion pathway protein F n=1 Tax=Salinisphaera shabanensis E1L3A TaxID=1033802 RepID=F7Q2Y2_9GAMM|nr:type II secretion system inner membrane protein GspF [Salinisphaera shabanensis]ERJ17918.1 T2aSS secretion system inner membrane platform protein GspF [Salinisphaera shabanensis E1L3A]